MTTQSLLGNGNGKRKNKVSAATKFLYTSKALICSSTIVLCFFCSIILVTAETKTNENSIDAVKENIQKLIGKRECRGCYLEGAILNGLNLKEVDLSNANLNFARFNLATLRGANLRKSSLLGTSFNGADVSEADFRGGDTTGASFLGAYTLNALFGDLPEEEISATKTTLQNNGENSAEQDGRIISEPISGPERKELEFISPAVVD